MLFFLKDQIQISKKEKTLFKIFLILMIFAIIFLIMNRTTFADRIALPLILFQGYVIGKIFSILKYKMVKNIFISLTMMF